MNTAKAIADVETALIEQQRNRARAEVKRLRAINEELVKALDWYAQMSKVILAKPEVELPKLLTALDFILPATMATIAKAKGE
jgi:hypothetical protein